jgi:hypothetical protein
MVGDPESKRLKVAAQNLFHPTASPLFRKAVFSYYDTVSGGERARGRIISGRFSWLEGDPAVMKHYKMNGGYSNG